MLKAIIFIGNSGTLAENNTTRIGTDGSGSGQQNRLFLAGITSSALSNKEYIVVDSSTGQIGKIAGIPFSIVTQVFTSNGTYTPTTGMLYCVAEVVG